MTEFEEDLRRSRSCDGEALRRLLEPHIHRDLRREDGQDADEAHMDLVDR